MKTNKQKYYLYHRLFSLCWILELLYHIKLSAVLFTNEWFNGLISLYVVQY